IIRSRVSTRNECSRIRSSAIYVKLWFLSITAYLNRDSLNTPLCIRSTRSECNNAVPGTIQHNGTRILQRSFRRCHQSAQYSETTETVTGSVCVFLTHISLVCDISRTKGAATER